MAVNVYMYYLGSGSCPTGWTEDTTTVDCIFKGGAAYSAPTGSTTHTHTGTPAVTGSSTSTSGVVMDTDSGTKTADQKNHSHPSTTFAEITSAAESVKLTSINVQLCYRSMEL